MRSTRSGWVRVAGGVGIGLLLFAQLFGSGVAPSAYQLVMQSGAGLARRNTLNFDGSGVTCVDNAGLSRTDCTVTGSVVPSGVYLFSSIGSVTHAAASEHTIIGTGTGSLTLPAGYFASDGDTLMVSASGYYGTPVGPGTLRIRLKFGSTVILDTGAFTPAASMTNQVWSLEAKITARSVGVGGTVMGQAQFRPVATSPTEQGWQMPNTAAVAVNTTGTLAVDLTAAWSAAGGETITGTNFIMYGVLTSAGPTGYATLQNNTSAITQRATLNNGSGVYCLDNAGSGRSDCYVGFAVANEGVTGTAVNKLAKLTGAPSTAIVTTAGDTGGSVGIVVAGAGAAGSAVVATQGTVGCVFDGATTAGHYVGISAGTAGDCTDAGATWPTSGQVIGRVLTTNGGGGTYNVVLASPEVQAGGGGGALVRIAQQVLGAPAASVTFAAIPGTYTTLIIDGIARSDSGAGSSTSIGARFNADAGANYTYVYDFAANSTVTSGNAAGQTSAFLANIPNANGAANVPGIFRTIIPGYKGTTFIKALSTGYTENINTGTFTTTSQHQMLNTGNYWNNTAAITDITLLPAAGNFITGSVFTLYGQN